MDSVFSQGKKYRRKAIIDINGKKAVIKYNTVETIKDDNLVTISGNLISFSPNIKDGDIKLIKDMKITKKIKKYHPSSPISKFSLTPDDLKNEIKADFKVAITQHKMENLSIDQSIGKNNLKHLTFGTLTDLEMVNIDKEIAEKEHSGEQEIEDARMEEWREFLESD